MNDRPEPPDRPDDPAGARTDPAGAQGAGGDAARAPASRSDRPTSDGPSPESHDPRDSAPTMPRRQRPAWQPALVIAAILALSGVVAVALSGGDDNDDRDVQTDRAPADQAAEEDQTAQDDETTSAPAAASAATVAVTFGEASLATTPSDLTLRFLDTSGTVIATRSWSEVEQGTGGSGDVTAMRGLVQDVPAGDLTLEATLQQSGQPASCTQRFAPTRGDRLILRLEQGSLGGAGQACAPVQSVDEWVRGRTSRTGQPYVGLGVAEAQDRAEGAGLTTRVAGVDGMDLALTMDLQPNRLNLLVFDGTVVAAQLEGESSGG